MTVASITYQSLFLLYPTLSGMTGTSVKLNVGYMTGMRRLQV